MEIPKVGHVYCTLGMNVVDNRNKLMRLYNLHGKSKRKQNKILDDWIICYDIVNPYIS